MKPPVYSGVFRILLLRVLSVNKNFPLRVLTAGAIILFLNITGAIAPMAPVLNTPLDSSGKREPGQAQVPTPTLETNKQKPE